MTVKHCACGRRYDEASWKGLPLLGVMDGDGELVELRNCACNTTLAIVIAGEKAETDAA